ncbi:hypothetical protein BDZ91DRAFT_731772 [Kalaharituber pfeilii]|nr:hypothetical protein BDZ91DRAFT_731772 [Kalaharituber pfeilii]
MLHLPKKKLHTSSRRQFNQSYAILLTLLIPHVWLPYFHMMADIPRLRRHSL